MSSKWNHTFIGFLSSFHNSWSLWSPFPRRAFHLCHSFIKFIVSSAINSSIKIPIWKMFPHFLFNVRYHESNWRNANPQLHKNQTKDSKLPIFDSNVFFLTCYKIKCRYYNTMRKCWAKQKNAPLFNETINTEKYETNLPKYWRLTNSYGINRTPKKKPERGRERES